jgi:hypothetical protein
MLTSLPPFVGPLVVVLHGLGHGGALIALAWIAARPGSSTGRWTAARSWVLPGLSARTVTVIAVTFWAVCLVAFVVAGAGMAGLAGAAEVWPWLAVTGAVVSLAGIGLFLGIWPAFNTLAALAVDVGILALVVSMR